MERSKGAVILRFRFRDGDGWLTGINAHAHALTLRFEVSSCPVLLMRLIELSEWAFWSVPLEVWIYFGNTPISTFSTFPGIVPAKE